MLLHLIRKEIALHLVSLRFVLSVCLCLGLVGVSICATSARHLRARNELAAAKLRADERLRRICSQPDPRQRYSRIFNIEGIEEPVPLSSLSWLSQGVQEKYPRVFVVRLGSTMRLDRTMTGNPLAGMLRAPDFVFVVSALLSLLATMFMFDAVCGEKEDGTLRLMLANPVGRHQVLLGKWLGGYVLFVAPFILAVLAGMIHAGSLGLLLPENYAQIAVLVSGACLYLGVFFNLSLCVSCLNHRSSTSMLICLLAWVVLVLVVPGLSPVTARLLVPCDSPDTVRRARQAVEREFADRRKALFHSARGRSDRDWRDAEAGRLDREKKRALDRIMLTRDRQRFRQQALARDLGRISPAACWTYAAVALAGTGPDALARTEAALHRLERDTREFARDLRRARDRSPGRAWPDFGLSRVPRLRVVPASSRQAIIRALPNLLLLFMFNVLFFMGAYLRFLGYDAR